MSEHNGYDRWEARARDAAASLAGLGLILYEATRLQPSRDLIIAGVFLLVAPKARRRIVEKLLGDKDDK